MKRLNETFTQEDQNVVYQSLWSAFKQKLKVTVKRNAYDFQSYARVKIFDPEKRSWNLLASIPYPQMNSRFVSVYDKKNVVELNINLFKTDETELLRLAELILT